MKNHLDQCFCCPNRENEVPQRDSAQSRYHDDSGPAPAPSEAGGRGCSSSSSAPNSNKARELSGGISRVLAPSPLWTTHTQLVLRDHQFQLPHFTEEDTEAQRGEEMDRVHTAN